MGAVGDQDRVEAVFRRVHHRLWRSLLLFTGDAELASDAVAEAFAQVLRRGDAVDDVEAWVWRGAFRIAAGLAATRSSSTDFAVDDSTLPTGSLVEFLGLLRELSPQQRACVALRYVGEYTTPAGAIVTFRRDGTTLFVKLPNSNSEVPLGERSEIRFGDPNSRVFEFHVDGQGKVTGALMEQGPQPLKLLRK